MTLSPRITVAFLLSLSACATGRKAVQSDAPPPADVVTAVARMETAPAPVAPEPKPLLTFGLARPVGPDLAPVHQEGLGAYLSEALSGRVVTRLYPSPTALAHAVARGDVDAAWMTPLAYVRAAEKTKLVPLAKVSRDGFTTYRSVIFAKADAELKTLDDLRGKRFAWAGRGSASGRLFPEAHLRRRNIQPDVWFGAQVHAASHREVCLLVLSGAVEAGATLSNEPGPDEAPVVDGCREAGFDPSAFVALERTDAIPNDVVAVRSELEAHLTNELRAALLGMTPEAEVAEHVRALFNADGFVEVSDNDFATVREVESLLFQP